MGNTIKIEIDNAESVSNDLSDLLCWWEGFKIGLKVGNDSSHFMVAENGVEAARSLNIKIKDQLIISKR